MAGEPHYLVGYGTLLLRASLGSSIGQAEARRKPVRLVTVEGYPRVFNLRPDHYPSSHKLGAEDIERAAMNVEPAAGRHFNGIAFETSAAELEALDLREAPYLRQVVPIRDFARGAPAGRAHLYIGREPWITRDLARLLPYWRDIVWGRTGAYELGEAFGTAFDETTYLGDGETLVVDVYRRFLSDTSDVEPPPAFRHALDA